MQAAKRYARSKQNGLNRTSDIVQSAGKLYLTEVKRFLSSFIVTFELLILQCFEHFEMKDEKIATKAK